jgi:hypothetical protein
VNGWNPDEKKHRHIERWYWLASWVLSVLIAAGALVSAIFVYKAWSEAHEQALQARRQANIAFANTTRAWLKLTTISGGADRSDSNTAYIWFTPTYKNLGHTPARNISFFWHMFVIGIPAVIGIPGPPGMDVCEEAKSHPNYSGEVVFPQDDGGGREQSLGMWIVSTN